MKTEMEIRAYGEKPELRAGEGESRVVEGYALVFGVESRDLGGFVEVIDRDALTQADLVDVVARTNHNNNYLLARSPGTLSLTVDQRGLKYRFEAPNTTAGNDLLEQLRRGDISKSSFAFSIDENGDKWERRGGIALRTITKIKRIYDVAPVVEPAYPQTDVAKRSFEAFMEEKTQNYVLNARQKLALLKIKGMAA